MKPFVVACSHSPPAQGKLRIGDLRKRIIVCVDNTLENAAQGVTNNLVCRDNKFDLK